MNNKNSDYEIFDAENCLPYEEWDSWYESVIEDEEEERMVRDIHNIYEWTDSELTNLRSKINKELEDRRTNREIILKDLLYASLNNYLDFLGEDVVIGNVLDEDFNPVPVYLSCIKDWFYTEKENE